MERLLQLSMLQLLVYLLPPCNSDTLYRLLQFLDKVAEHAQDFTGPDGQEVMDSVACAPIRLCTDTYLP